MVIRGKPRQTWTGWREGILFERAFCDAPLCTPSRQSLITGKLPHAVGVTQLGTRLPDDVLTMVMVRDLRYQTAAIGKMHFNGPSGHGFTERIDTADWESDLRAHPPGAATVADRGGRCKIRPPSGSTPTGIPRDSPPSRCSPLTSLTAPWTS